MEGDKSMRGWSLEHLSVCLLASRCCAVLVACLYSVLEDFLARWPYLACPLLALIKNCEASKIPGHFQICSCEDESTRLPSTQLRPAIRPILLILSNCNHRCSTGWERISSPRSLETQCRSAEQSSSSLAAAASSRALGPF